MSEPTPEFLAFAQDRRDKLQRELQLWFERTRSPRVLEIGCGHGHFLISYAKANPSHACLGIDLINHRLRLCNRKKRIHAVPNIDFLKARAEEVLQVLPAGASWDRIFVLYPDPWPKKRQEKHRLIQKEFLDDLARATTAGVEFFFRTDHEGYFQWTQKYVLNHPQWRIMPDCNWPCDTKTFFQDLMQKAYSLVAMKNKGPESAK